MLIRESCLSLALSLSVLAWAGEASAQSAAGAISAAQNEAGNFFARDRNVAVRERARPEYEALGLGLGMFAVYPVVQIDVEHNDNIFAVETGADSDWIVRIKPELSVESGWSRHALNAYARANVARYQDFDEENFEDWSIGADARLDITRAGNIALGYDHSRVTEPRTSSNAPASTREPVSYDLDAAYVAASRTSGRLRLSGRADIRTFDYEDAVTLGGLSVDQDNRDRTITSLTGRADLAISPATAWFVQATSNARDYDTAASPLLPARDSDGYEILAGVNFEVGALARGEIAVGYIAQTFEASSYRDIDGFGARAELEWFPTQITTVSGYASRTIEDSGLAGSGGYLSTAVGVRLDHELRRNVLFNAELTVARDEYDDIGREDERVQASVGGTYLLNRNLGVSLAASRFEQTSSGTAAGVEFEVNRLTATLVAQF
jgi:hypothetical protein